MRIVYKGNNIIKAARGIKLNNGISYYNNIFNADGYLDYILQQLKSNGSSYADWLNNMQHSHSSIYGDANKSDYYTTAYSGGNGDTRIKDYQDAYKSGYNNSEGNNPGGYNRFGISNIANSKGFDVSGTRTSGDYNTDINNPWKSDNLFSGITDLRRMLGRKGDFDDAQLQNIISKFKDLGYDFYEDTDDNGYYKLRPLSTPQNYKYSNIQPPKLPTTLPYDKRPISERYAFNASPLTAPTVKKPVFNNNTEVHINEPNFDTPLKRNIDFSGLVPDALSVSRLALALRNNQRVTDILRKSLNPVLQNTYERYSPVTGAFSEMQLRNKQAAELQSRASRPFTSDASLTMAALLDANKQANELQHQGFLADDKEIKRTSAEALARQEDNMARRSDIANKNMLAINQTNRERAELEAQRLKNNWQSVDNFLSGLETRMRSKFETRQTEKENFDLETELFTLNEQYKEAKKPYDDAVAAWLAKHGTWATPTEANFDHYKEWQQYLNEITAKFKQKRYEAQARIKGFNYTPAPIASDEFSSTNPFLKIREKYHFKFGGKVTPKLLKGGSFGNFFATYTPALAQQPAAATTKAASSKSSSDSDKGELTQKDFFNMIKDVDGLPNEMLLMVNKLQFIFDPANIVGLDSLELSALYLKSLYQLKLLRQNKEHYDAAVKHANNANALTEPAITTEGLLMVLDSKSGKVGKIRVDQYNHNKDRYVPLTVSQLADLRKYDSSLVLNYDIINTINNSMGYTEFNKLMKDGITGLGASENKNNNLYTLTGQAIKGLEALQNMTPEERVNALNGTIMENTTTKESYKQIMSLIQYLSSIAPLNMKIWAAYKQGQDNPEKAIRLAVLEYLMAQSNDSQDIQTDYKTLYNWNASTDRTEKANERAKEKAAGTVKDKETFITALQKGTGGRNVSRVLNTGGQADLHVSGTAYGAISDTSGAPINNATLGTVLEKSRLQSITDVNSIYFGDLLIPSTILNKIAVTNGGALRVILPIKPGTSRPDFELIDSYDEVVQEVNNELGSNGTYEQRQALFERKLQERPELSSLLSNGKIDPNKFMPFVILSGLASDINFDLSEVKSPYIQETGDDIDASYFELVVKDPAFDKNDSFFGDNIPLISSYSHVYKSDIFIPIAVPNRLAAIIASGQKIIESSARDIEQEYQEYDQYTGQSKSLKSYNPNELGV